MYYISEFCRVCLQYEKPLVDITKKDADSETLVNKLKLCVSEVEWSSNENIFMCQACIDKLNSAFEFKRQCLQSAQALESYISQLVGSDDSEDRVGGKVYVSVNRNEVKQELVDEYLKLQKEEEESHKPTAFIRVKSNQQLYPTLPNIILTAAANNTANNQNTTFQNIFLNLIPSSAIKYPASNIQILNARGAQAKSPAAPVGKDANQNMFLNINNTLHKIFPIVAATPPSPTKEGSKPSPAVKPEELNIFRLLTESTTEELSIEVDPMCFEDEEEPLTCNETTDIAKDWEELISSTKISPETLSKRPKVQVKSTTAESNNFAPFVPIRPKSKKDLITAELEETMMEFLNVDHFMAPKVKSEHKLSGEHHSLICEQCGQVCDTLKALRYHIKQFHLGKFPYKCRHCSSVYALKTQYESHMKKHVMRSSDAFCRDTITLEDLSSQNEAIFFPKSVMTPNKPPAGGSALGTPTNTSLNTSESNADSPDENGGVQFDHKCEVCPRSFNSAHGLSRHKVRKHNQQTRRKYFVKGMKNAKCDICNREFSTQSYLQLHIKLHYRKNDYRLKVFNKDKYEREKKEELEAEAAAVNHTKESPPSNKTDRRNEEPQEKPEAIKAEEAKPLNKGIKIKINLRNLKPEKNKKPPLSEAENSEDSEGEMVIDSGGDDGVDKTGMDVDGPEDESCVNGDVEDRVSSDSSEASPDANNMDCDESGEVSSSNAEEFSEEADYLKDEGSPEGRRPPVKIVLVDGKPQCTFCYKLFSRKHDLKRHVNNIHLKAIQYVCHLCNSQFYEAFHLTRHLRQHSSFVRCTGCMKDFSVLRDLKLHMLAVHEEMNVHESPVPCQCGTCGQVFEKIKHLREHMHEHDKTIVYKCHICSDQLSESRELTKHLVGHSGMYSCGTCQTTFTTEHELSNHKRCHGESGKEVHEQTKHECEICHNKFKKKRYLSVHMNSRHKRNTDFLISRVESECDSS